jgi:hypothetical protein
MTPRYRTASMSSVAVLAATTALVGCGAAEKKRTLTLQEMIAADPLPLAKGAKWTYDVTVKRYDAENDKTTTKSLKWSTEVIDVREANGVTAFRVRGWPTDLEDFDVTPAATEKTILRSGNNFMWGTSADPDLDGAEGWFSWPVIDGQKICPRSDESYCWQVAAIETGYALSFYTGPDEQTFELEPGTGVARFHYAHHGTTNEVDARLVSYSKGRR